MCSNSEKLKSFPRIVDLLLMRAPNLLAENIGGIGGSSTVLHKKLEPKVGLIVCDCTTGYISAL